jgi:ankyrin repeat protein
VKGADILEKIAPTNKSPLHLAAEKSYLDCVDILLNGIKSVTPPVSPIHQTATNSNSKKKSPSQDSILAETISTIVDSNCETPLHVAARENNKEICERLLLYGFDLNFKSNYDKFPHELCTNETLKNQLYGKKYFA